MILNMNYGSSQVQLVDFTLEQDHDLSYPYFTISGIKPLPEGVHCFFVRPKSAYVPVDYNVVWLICPNYSVGVTEGVFYYIYSYDSQFDSDLFHGNIESTQTPPFSYNATAGTLQFQFGLSNLFMKAGDYQLVIW